MRPVYKLNEDQSDLSRETNIYFFPEHLRSELLKYCRKLTRSSWDAEDLTQEALLKSLTQIAEHKNPKAYLFRIAKNAWIDQCRKQKEEMELNEQVMGNRDRDLLRVKEALTLLIQKLSPLQCSIFLLREVWSYSAQEVAELIGTTEGAVKSALYRARRNLMGFKNQEMGEDGLVEGEETEKQKALLKTLMNAFISEDMEELFVLAQNDVIHPVQALSSLWEFEVQINKTEVSSCHTIQAMAA